MHICVEFNKFDVNVRLCAHTKNGPEQRTRWEVRERERKSHNLVRIHTELLKPRTTNGKIKNRANKKIVCFRVVMCMIEWSKWLIDWLIVVVEIVVVDDIDAAGAAAFFLVYLIFNFIFLQYTYMYDGY